MARRLEDKGWRADHALGSGLPLVGQASMPTMVESLLMAYTVRITAPTLRRSPKWFRGRRVYIALD